MNVWRRQTFIVGMCFAVVFAARIYFQRIVANQGQTQAIESPTADTASDRDQGPRDTVVSLDDSP